MIRNKLIWYHVLGRVHRDVWDHRHEELPVPSSISLTKFVHDRTKVPMYSLSYAFKMVERGEEFWKTKVQANWNLYSDAIEYHHYESNRPKRVDRDEFLDRLYILKSQYEQMPLTLSANKREIRQLRRRMEQYL